MIPPLLVYVRVDRLRIPVPVVLLWPLLFLALALALVVLPFVRIGDTTSPQRVVGALRGFQALCLLRGLVADVRSHDGRVVCVRIW